MLNVNVLGLIVYVNDVTFYAPYEIYYYPENHATLIKRSISFNRCQSERFSASQV